MQVLKPFKVTGATRSDWYLDASLAATGIFLVNLPFMIVLVLLARSVSMYSAILTGILGMGIFCSVVLRHHYPGVFFIVVMILVVLQMIWLSYPTISWIVIPLAMFDVARRLAPYWARIGLAIALIVAFIWPIRWMVTALVSEPNLRTIMILAGVAAAGAVSTAYSVGRRGYEVEAAHSRQVLAEKDAAQLQIAEQAARQHSLETQVRTTIARELHDIVAHSISVMVVQAEGGLAQVEQSPGTAQEALGTISETGREALAEMRRIVRTLRSDSDQIDVTSAPTLADLPQLVEKAQASLAVDGMPHGTTPTIEMTIYRIIQEALTNSLKHAGPDADPQVQVNWYQTNVFVIITNNLTTSTPVNDHRGTGLIGMAERVQALDGTLSAGPTKTGGFEVCAQIPLLTYHQP